MGARSLPLYLILLPSHIIADIGVMASVHEQAETCTREGPSFQDAFIGAHLSGLKRVNEKKERGPRTLRHWDEDSSLTFLENVEYDGSGHLVISSPGRYRIRSHLDYSIPRVSSGTQASHHVVRYDATSQTEAILQSTTVSASTCHDWPCDGYSDITVYEILNAGDMVYIKVSNSHILNPRKSDSYFELIAL